ncbi:Transcription factor RF2a [Hibiscus syriacus]|uniref:Transcription factor RF2a n=1 Tax=Hibiscus syriacus TaxID=106335 RepID=A0A6A2XB04_HIBSY|nr:Transcription factor RF2a [Hibiscus syriacus]
MEQKLKVSIDQMPPRGAHHRRGHSDTTFRFDDLLLFDPSDLDLSSLDLPPFSSNPTPPSVIPVPTDSSDDSSSGGHPPLSSHGAGDEKFGGKAGVGEKRAHHRHTNTMDGSFEVQSLMAVDGVKTAMAPERLAELALIDPKRAKRILANRQSAARSKERKVRYTNELERKVQTLQKEATNLCAQVKPLQRDTTGLTTENKELKLRLQAMEQQSKLRDALNDALREEVQRLKIQASQMSATNRNPFNRGPLPQFLPHQPAPHFGDQQIPQHQQLQIHPSSINNQTLNGQPQTRFMDFNHNTWFHFGRKFIKGIILYIEICICIAS